MDNFNTFKNNEQVENSTSGLSPETRSSLFDDFSSLDFSQNSSSSLDFLPGLDLVDSDGSQIGSRPATQESVPQKPEKSDNDTTHTDPTNTNPSTTENPAVTSPLDRSTPETDFFSS